MLTATQRTLTLSITFHGDVKGGFFYIILQMFYGFTKEQSKKRETSASSTLEQYAFARMELG